MNAFFFIMILMYAVGAQNALAWGKRGHALICEAAAYTLEKEASFLKFHSFDMGYYCNVPDIIWRRPVTNSEERDEHYVDLEIFERAMGKDGTWEKDRKKFFKKYPDAQKAGMAYWRISELCEELQKTDNWLRGTNNMRVSAAAFKSAQKSFLSLAGAIGHYVGDLSQPLHTTENHDGQLSGQKGVHSFYETELVNELYPGIAKDVFDETQRVYSENLAKKELDCFDLAKELAETSHKEIKELLENDKKADRKIVQEAVNMHKKNIIRQLARGGGFVALLWSKHFRWPYQGKDFFEFDESPSYQKPVKP